AGAEDVAEGESRKFGIVETAEPAGMVGDFPGFTDRTTRREVLSEYIVEPMPRPHALDTRGLESERFDRGGGHRGEREQNGRGMSGGAGIQEVPVREGLPHRNAPRQAFDARAFWRWRQLPNWRRGLWPPSARRDGFRGGG